MEKFKIDNLGVFKHPVRKEYFVGYYTENCKYVKNLDGIKYESVYDDERNGFYADFLNPLVYYYPTPLYNNPNLNIIEIEGKKTIELPPKVVAGNKYITKSEVKNFEEKQLNKICKKEEKLIKSGKLVKSRVFLPEIEDNENTFDL